jgi:hypothetical protein
MCPAYPTIGDTTRGGIGAAQASAIGGIGQSWSESAVCLLDPRRRCRQQAAQGVEAEVVDGLRQACGSDEMQQSDLAPPTRLDCHERERGRRRDRMRASA